MCKPYLFRDIFGTSDTRTSTYKRTENILTAGREEVKTYTPFPGLRIPFSENVVGRIFSRP